MQSVKLVPSEITIDRKDMSVYAGLWDIKSNDDRAYNVFIEKAKQAGIFSFSNSGKYGISSTHTYDDGKNSLKWLASLLELSYMTNMQEHIPVYIELNKKFLLEKEVLLFSKDPYLPSIWLKKSLSTKIVDTYIYTLLTILKATHCYTECKSKGRMYYRVQEMNDKIIFADLQI